jgi:hypothetical protein
VTFLLWIFTKIDDQIQVLTKIGQLNIVIFGRVSEDFIEENQNINFISNTGPFLFPLALRPNSGT